MLLLRRLAALLALIALTACSEEPAQHYDEAHLSIEPATNKLTVYINGRVSTPCPPAMRGYALVNGVRMKQHDSGGRAAHSDDDPSDFCNPLSFETTEAPLDTGKLTVTFVLTQDGRELPETRAWSLEADWTPPQVWVEDDMAARMNDGAEFDLFWTPRDTIVPKLHLSARDEDVDVPLDAEVQVVSSTEGAARLRFTGRPPELPWSFVASRDPTRDIDCIGFDSCVLDSDYSVDLQPGGISPIVPADTPWPRNCIAGPTRSQRDYVSRVSSYFPDLSSVHVARHEDCDSADLYFALLGACAVPDGGKSTYVVGNRGTRATRFAVQSNQEGVVGGTLEPQQLSKPFEIAFSGPSSKLEIFVDDDCDLTSNSVDVDVSNTP